MMPCFCLDIKPIGCIIKLINNNNEKSFLISVYHKIHPMLNPIKHVFHLLKTTLQIKCKRKLDAVKALESIQNTNIIKQGRYVILPVSEWPLNEFNLLLNICTLFSKEWCRIGVHAICIYKIRTNINQPYLHKILVTMKQKRVKKHFGFSQCYQNESINTHSKILI